MPFYQYRNREIQRKTCLRGFGGRDFILSAVFASETLKEHSQTFEAGKWFIPVGSFLTYFTSKYESIEPDPTKVKIYEKLGANANAVQTITPSGTLEGGSFTLGYGGQTTANIAYNATAAEIVTAVAKLSTIATGSNFKTTSTTTKKLTEEALKFEFTGELGNKSQPLLVVNYAGLTGTTPKLVATTTTPGTTAEKIIGVYDGSEFDAWGNTAGEENLDQPIPIYFQNCTFNKLLLPEYVKYGVEAEEALKTCTFV